MCGSGLVASEKAADTRKDCAGWSCAACTYQNESPNAACGVCGSPRTAIRRDQHAVNNSGRPARGQQLESSRVLNDERASSPSKPPAAEPDSHLQSLLARLQLAETAAAPAQEPGMFSFNESDEMKGQSAEQTSDFPPSGDPFAGMNAKERRKAKRAAAQHSNEQLNATNPGSQAEADSANTVQPPIPIAGEDLYTLLIHFHHILNEDKRESVQSWAWELHLGGVSRTGTPGPYHISHIT